MSKQKSKTKKPKRARPLRPTSCPCGGGEYAGCCGPLHTGERDAGSPEQLMRSRYSAFAVQDADYLFRTLHTGHPDREGGQDGSAFIEGLRASFGQLRYGGLKVLDCAAPDAHGTAQVLFLARVSQHRLDRSFVEQSDFAQEDGQWRYLAGTTRPLSGLSHAPEHMRIGHWDCDHHHH